MIEAAPDLVKQADRPPPPPGVVEDSAKVLDELNLESAVVKIGAKTRVLQFEITPHEVDGERYITASRPIWRLRTSAIFTSTVTS